MTKMKAISSEELAKLSVDYLTDAKARVVRNALTVNDLGGISRVFDATAANPDYFSINIKTLPVTNQMASGRLHNIPVLTGTDSEHPDCLQVSGAEATLQLGQPQGRLHTGRCSGHPLLSSCAIVIVWFQIS